MKNILDKNIYSASDESYLYNIDCMKVLPKIADKYFDLAVIDVPDGSKRYFRELFRVSKNQIIFGANNFISKLPKKDSSCWIVWDKDNAGSEFADCELIWTSFKSVIRKFKFRWNNTLWEDNKDRETCIHPAQKPLQLYLWLLNKYAKSGDKILDTHAGQCISSRVAAFYTGCEFTGFESDEHCCEVSSERFVDEIINQTMLN